MKPTTSVGCTYTPIWFKRLRNVLPLTLGLLIGTANATATYAAPTTSETTSINQTKGTVSGRITDNTGEGLVGVTVVVKGTKVRTTTDANGKYTIKANAGQTLVYSYIGYKRVEKKVTASTMNVELESIDNTLNEAVVIGYGTVRKADLAGAVAVMDNKQFKDQPITQVSDALQGRVAGVQVLSDGTPGGDIKIRVRGSSSINKSNEPLYVVDGIVRESGLEGINPEDIQSLQVLKDASSTAIYGARGANGVVLVQTKSGKAGQTQVVFDASVGVSNAYHIPEKLGTAEYAQALVANGLATSEAMTDYLNGTNPGIDWMDELLQTGVTQNYKLAISKGNEDTQFYVSGNYLDHKGVIYNTEFKRYAVKANVHSKLYKWLELTADVNLSRGQGKGGGFHQNQDNPIWNGLNFSPTMNMLLSNGNYARDPYNVVSQANPYGALKENDNDRMRDVVNGHIDLKFNIVDGLTFTTTNGVDYKDSKSYSFVTAKVNPQGSSSASNADTYQMLLQTTNNLTYNHNWNGHGLTATGVWEATSYERRYMVMKGTNLLSESVGYWNIDNAKSKTVSNSYQKWALLSAVARVMYNYKDKYMLTGTFRADGSSRFTNKKWGYFPSVAAAWTVSQEDFMKNVKPVSNLKIRASYGIIGNQDVDPYSTMVMLSATSFDFGTNNMYTGYWPHGVETPDLTWEKVHQFDFGVDLGLFENRLSVGFDYYYKKTKDALLRETSSDIIGGMSYWVNEGEVENKGFDLTLTGRIIQTRDWQWTSTFSFSHNKNKVVKLNKSIDGASPAAGTVDPCTIIMQGEAIGTFYGYKWAGVEQNAEGQWIDMYYDKNGNKTATPSGDDRQLLGNASPKLTVGWNNTLSYKNWDFSFFFNSAFGGKRLNLVRYTMNSTPGASKFVTDKDYFNNVGKDMPTLGAGSKVYGNSDKWIENATYVRLENLSVAYTLPKSMTKFADLRISVSGQNLFTITKYKGIDPAGNSFHSGGGNANAGIDMGTYPNPRTFTFGVRATF